MKLRPRPPPVTVTFFPTNETKWLRYKSNDRNRLTKCSVFFYISRCKSITDILFISCLFVLFDGNYLLYEAIISYLISNSE